MRLIMPEVTLDPDLRAEDEAGYRRRYLRVARKLDKLAKEMEGLVRAGPKPDMVMDTAKADVERNACWLRWQADNCTQKIKLLRRQRAGRTVRDADERN